jgi:hypothetical protein
VAGGQDQQPLPEQFSSCQHVSFVGLSIGISWIAEKADQCRFGYCLAQGFELLCPQRIDQEADPGDIAARPIQAGDKPQLDRIATDCNEDGNGCRAWLSCDGRRNSAHRHDERDLVTDQLGCKRRQSIILLLRPAVFERNVSALDVASFLQASLEWSQTVSVRLPRSTAEQTNYRHRRTLRPHHERPRCRHAAE